MHTRATPDLFPTEGTVLLHISQAIKQDQVIHYTHVLHLIVGLYFYQELGKEFVKCLKVLFSVCMTRLTSRHRQGWLV